MAYILVERQVALTSLINALMMANINLIRKSQLAYRTTFLTNFAGVSCNVVLADSRGIIMLHGKMVLIETWLVHGFPHVLTCIKVV